MGILDGVLGTVGGLTGGLTGGSTSGSTSGAVSVGGGTSVGTSGLLDGILGGVTGAGSGGTTGGLLDGVIALDLLNEDALLGIGVLPDQNGSSVIDIRLLDPDGDGLIDLGLLKGTLGLSVLDQDGDGLISLNLLNTINLDLDLSGDLDGDGIPDDSTDPTDFDVVLMGTEGADAFRIDASLKTYVEGRGGIDVATYVQSAADFNYALTANGVFMFNGDKVDYLQNVERITFTDGTLALDTGIGEVTGFAYRIYQAAFDRAPDAAGLLYWIDQLDDGMSMIDVAAGFIFSAEFQRTYGSLSDTDFVEELYENVLQRAGEDAGIDYWSDQLAGGTSRAQVLAGFTDSAENVELVGSVIAEGVFLSA